MTKKIVVPFIIIFGKDVNNNTYILPSEKILMYIQEVKIKKNSMILKLQKFKNFQNPVTPQMTIQNSRFCQIRQKCFSCVCNRGTSTCLTVGNGVISWFDRDPRYRRSRRHGKHRKKFYDAESRIPCIGA